MTTARRGSGPAGALALATVAFTICFFAWSLLGPLGPDIQDELGLSDVQLSAIIAVPVLLGSIMRIPLGWLTDRHGGFSRAALETDFDRTLILKSVLVGLLVAGGLLHDYVLGPRLQRELRAHDAAAPATRRRLVAVGWFNFGLTIAVPVLGAVVLTTLD